MGKRLRCRFTPTVCSYRTYSHHTWPGVPVNGAFAELPADGDGAWETSTGLLHAVYP